MKLLAVLMSAFQGEIQSFALFSSCSTTLTVSPCPVFQAVGIWDSIWTPGITTQYVGSCPHKSTLHLMCVIS